MNPTDRLSDKVGRALRNLLSRAVVSLVSDSPMMQELQLKALSGEVIDRAERFQNYGHTSHPPQGSEAAVLHLGADRSHSVAVAVDNRRHRPRELAEGESKLYHLNGDFIHMKNGNEIEIFSKARVVVRAPEVQVECDKATLEASESIDMSTQVFSLKAAKSISLDTTAFTLNAAATAAILSPAIGLCGALSATALDGQSPTTAKFTGTINTTGDVNAQGELTAANGRYRATRHKHYYTIGAGETGYPIQ